MSQLQCLIKSRGSNEEFRKTAEVVGEGKDYLKSLSSGLSQIQQEANAFLTVLVEKEKAEKLGDVTASKVTTANSGDEGVCMCVCVAY